jgi:hypothetical protein
VLGEHAQFEVRAFFYNLFNNLNLKGGDLSSGGGINNFLTASGASGPISNPAFGQAQSALGSRTIEFEGRFNF